MNTIKVMLDEWGILPTRAHNADAGLDLYTPYDITIWPHSSEVINTGVHVAIPKGYAGMLISKSGLNVNCNLTSTGLIDAEYTGSITVKLYNHGDKRQKIDKGRKISQLVIFPVETPVIELVEEFEETERGANGFGSTDLKPQDNESI